MKNYELIDYMQEYINSCGESKDDSYISDADDASYVFYNFCEWLRKERGIRITPPKVWIDK